MQAISHAEVLIHLLGWSLLGCYWSRSEPRRWICNYVDPVVL